MKSKMKNCIFAVCLILALLLVSGCSNNSTTESMESEKLQAPDTTGVSEAVLSLLAESTEPTTEVTLQSTEDLTEDSKPAEEASTAATEPITAHTEQPTKPAQPTTPPVTEPPHQHNYSSTTVVAPTCSEKGYTKHSCSCGDSYNDNYTAALGHHFVDEVIAPTSTEKGYTKHTCDRCWYSYNDTYTDPVKVVFDINAAMEAGNAYALSIGFGWIDYSMVPSNSGYFPCEYIQGNVLELLGGQSWLEQEMRNGAQSTLDNLWAYPNFDPTKCNFRSYITYDSLTDTYTLYDLWGGDNK